MGAQQGDARRSSRRRAVIATLGVIASALAVAGGCQPTPPANTESVTGQLGHGTFYYNCIDVSDPYCPATSTTSSFPPAIAAGGRFVISYAPDGVDYSTGTLVAVNADYLVNQGAAPNQLGYPTQGASPNQAGPEVADILAAVRPGTGTVLMQQADGTVIDMTFVTIAAISQIVLAGADGGGIGSIVSRESVGDTATLSAQAQGPASQPLAGSVPWTWTSSNPGVLAIQTPQPGGSVSGPVTVLFEDAGTASLTAASGTLQATPVTFTVEQ